MKRYMIKVLFNGRWACYQIAETRQAAEAICKRLSWQTRIVVCCH
jgi:hypothetical protein